MNSAPENQPAQTTRNLGLLAVADELEAWADGLPQWDPQTQEPWRAYLDRRLGGEQVMAEKLRRMPFCILTTSSHGQDVDLTLAGVPVHSKQGLNGACRLWITTARKKGSSVGAHEVLHVSNAAIPAKATQ